MSPNREERFWARVDRRGPGECWSWVGAVNDDGYGTTRWGEGYSGVHRIAYELLVGPIPSGLVIDHLCRNTRCCNPAHLEPVTNAENVRRALAVRTHCPHGHEYTPENLKATATGSRSCLTCHRQREARRRQTNRQKESA